MGDAFLRRVLFIAIYGSFAIVAAVYVVTRGTIGEDAMVETAFLPWWLSLVDAPVLLIVVFVALGWLDLEEFV